MRNYIVQSIPFIIDNYRKLVSGKTMTIFLTTNQYKFRPTLWLAIKDVFRGEEGFIKKYQIRLIHDLIPTLEEQDTIIVGCDAGLSRSPAVAMAIAYILEDYELVDNMKEIYKFYNQDLYSAIINGE